MWPAIHSHLDLAHLVEVFSCFCSNPRPVHVEFVKYVLQYVSETLELDFKFDGEADTSDGVVRYTNLDFARSKID